MNPSMSIAKRLLRRAAFIAAAVLVASCGQHGLAPKLSVGDAVPLSRNQVLAPGQDWREVTTMDTRVRLYRWRIADLVEQRKPFIVVFGTPQHCSMCVDQIGRVAMAEEKYGDRFAFIHVDGYKDDAVWTAWGVKGEPWTFVVDSRGKVRKVFPGQTEPSLLEDQVRGLLAEVG